MDKETKLYELDLIDAAQDLKVRRMWRALYILIIALTVSLIAWPVYHDIRHSPVSNEVVIEITRGEE